MADKAKMGAPTKYDPAHCERIIELGNTGSSQVEMAFELGVCKNTLDNWAKEHPDFLNAFTRAKAASQVWWEKKGRSGMEKSNSEFQGNIWSRNMSARFPEDWRETTRSEHTGKDGEAIKVEEEISDKALAQRTAFILAKGQK